MNKSEKETILEKYYFNPKNAGAYMGPQKVFIELTPNSTLSLSVWIKKGDVRFEQEITILMFIIY